MCWRGKTSNCIHSVLKYKSVVGVCISGPPRGTVDLRLPPPITILFDL